MASKKKTSMTCLEQFSLASGVIGLIADVLALGAFAIQAINLSQDQQVDNLTPFVEIVMLFVLFYSWVIICWFIVRLHGVRVSELGNHAKPSANETAFSTVFGTSVFVSPFLAIWTALVFDLGYHTFIEEFFVALFAVAILLMLLDFVIALGIGMLANLVYPKLLD